MADILRETIDPEALKLSVAPMMDWTDSVINHGFKIALVCSWYSSGACGATGSV
ncbi:hypothetical protein [Lysobacter firmicutimachus]|uniref:Uncharacterized protein n=1 Tax=Lysobacter firmicutimachus TaxID=1792846 RepID=A0ABU8D0A0_9GAMM